MWKVSTVPPSFLMGHRQSFSASTPELPQPRVDDMKHLFYSISWGINKLHLLPKVHSTCFGTAVMTSHKNGVPMGFLYIYIYIHIYTYCMYIYIYIQTNPVPNAAEALGTVLGAHCSKACLDLGDRWLCTGAPISVCVCVYVWYAAVVMEIRIQREKYNWT